MNFLKFSEGIILNPRNVVAEFCEHFVHNFLWGGGQRLLGESPKNHQTWCVMAFVSAVFTLHESQILRLLEDCAVCWLAREVSHKFLTKHRLKPVKVLKHMIL